MRARKNIATMSPTERQAFADAVIEIHGRPSQRGLNNRYDDYARIHVDAMNVPVSWGHGGAAFTAWHRVLLAKFEEELRTVDDSLRIPYWDWTVDRTATSAPWFGDFLGGDGGATNPAGSESGEVTNGPFRHAAGDWTITTGDAGTNDDAFDRPYLARGFGRRGDAPQLPTAQEQTDVMNETLYSQFRWGLEVPLHNLVHRWVNGQMIWRGSPHDPVFWLHHCNLDRLWADWNRDKTVAARYTAPATAPSFFQPTGTMLFHDSTGAVGPATPTWPGTYRPVDTVGDHAFGVWYDTDPPEVTLTSPSVSFIDVEDGRTTYAAVTFDVSAVQSIGFEVLSSVPAPFGLPASLHPPAPVPPGDTAQVGRVWLSFTAAGVSAVAPITITVRCIQTGETWNVPVTANAIPQKTAAVALVVDRSGSMFQDAGNSMTKRQKLGQSLGIVAGLARDADQFALVSFDDQRDVVFPRGDVLAAGAGGTRDQLLAAATSADLDPRGLTGIGGGIQFGVAELAGATTDTIALVVVTDGVENVPPFIADVASSINSQTYAIGIGRPSDVNTAALSAICNGTDGYLLVTGDLAGFELFRLHKYFLQVHAGVTNQQIVVDPSGDLTVGAEHRVPFVLGRFDIGADVAVLSPVPALIQLTLEAPDGTVIDPAGGQPNVAPLSAAWLRGARMLLPLVPGVDHAGTWHAVLRIDEKALKKGIDGIPDELLALLRRGGVPYSLVVTARSDLSLRLGVRRRDDRAQVVALLDAYGQPFDQKAEVIALVTDPYGRDDKVRLDPRGAGRYTAVVDVPDAGLYSIRVLATGELDGERFTREQLASIATVSGKPSDDPGPDEHPKQPRPIKGRRVRSLSSLVQTARRPVPKPEPEVPTPEAIEMHRHAHTATSHFPSVDQVPKPEPWEPEAKGGGRKKPARKPGGSQGGARGGGRGGHPHG